METTMYFIFGMLTIIAIAFAVVIVVGMVKINKQQKTVEELNERIKGLHLDHSQQFDNVYRNIDQTQNELYRQINESRQAASSNIENVYRDVSNHFTDALTQSKSYTDSRIDKLIDTYFEVESVKKQIIKG
jgi:predicted PurR-regulated permease PerM